MLTPSPSHCSQGLQRYAPGLVPEQQSNWAALTFALVGCITKDEKLVTLYKVGAGPVLMPARCGGRSPACSSAALCCCVQRAVWHDTTGSLFQIAGTNKSGDALLTGDNPTVPWRVAVSVLLSDADVGGRCGR